MCPFADEDPFIVERAPAVYFVGNQPSFCTRMVTLHGTPTRLITLPAFAASGMNPLALPLTRTRFPLSASSSRVASLVTEPTRPLPLGMVVLLDLDTLEVEPLVFSSDALATPMQE